MRREHRCCLRRRGVLEVETGAKELCVVTLDMVRCRSARDLRGEAVIWRVRRPVRERGASSLSMRSLVEASGEFGRTCRLGSDEICFRLRSDLSFAPPWLNLALAPFAVPTPHYSIL